MKKCKNCIHWSNQNIKYSDGTSLKMEYNNLQIGACTTINNSIFETPEKNVLKTENGITTVNKIKSESIKYVTEDFYCKYFKSK